MENKFVIDDETNAFREQASLALQWLHHVDWEVLDYEASCCWLTGLSLGEEQKLDDRTVQAWAEWKATGEIPKSFSPALRRGLDPLWEDLRALRRVYRRNRDKGIKECEELLVNCTVSPLDYRQWWVDDEYTKYIQDGLTAWGSGILRVLPLSVSERMCVAMSVFRGFNPRQYPKNWTFEEQTLALTLNRDFDLRMSSIEILHEISELISGAEEFDWAFVKTS